MRSHQARAGRRRGGPADGGRWPYLFRALGWRPRDVVGVVAGALVTVAILINVLFMQSGSHPAPMFRGARAPAKAVVMTNGAAAPTARPRPVEASPATPPIKVASPPALRTPGDIINDIQRELVRRGYYDGVIDGLYGPKTDAAIRDFEQAAGLKPSSEPNEALLQAILHAPAKLVKGVTGATLAARAMPARNEVMAERPASSKRVIALQRALAEYGYGQIKPSGIIDVDTRAAIEKFERERRLPITGQPSDRVVRELAAMTGRPLE